MMKFYDGIPDDRRENLEAGLRAVYGEWFCDVVAEYRSRERSASERIRDGELAFELYAFARSGCKLSSKRDALFSMEDVRNAVPLGSHPSCEGVLGNIVWVDFKKNGSR
jgi:hypothetical protein